MKFPITKIASFINIDKVKEFLVVEFDNQYSGIIRGTTLNNYTVGQRLDTTIACDNQFFWKDNIVL
jgi:hypothetical protein